MVKKYLREWLGIEHDEKCNRLRWSALQNDLLDVTDHLGITRQVFPNRIFSREIKTGSIKANKITASVIEHG